MSLPKNRDPNKTNSSAVSENRCSEMTETRCAVLTGNGRSAVAVVAIRGPNAASLLLRCFTPVSKQPFSGGQIRFGQWHGDKKDSDVEAVVITPLGDDSFELHCHGGPAAIARIIGDLQQLGVDRVESMLAPEDAKLGDAKSWDPNVPLLIREAEQELSACLTSRTAAIALDQVRGAMNDWARQWKQRITAESQDIVREFHAQIGDVLANSPLGLHLSDPFRVVLSGPPNVGKSSLLNAIVGYDRSITLDVAGTTRDVLHADTVIEGIPIRLSDTAGIRESSEPIERQGVARARAAAEEADLVICVEQPAVEQAGCEPSDLESPRERTSTKAILNVLNKADLLSDADKSEAHDLQTVATNGCGVDELMQAIIGKLISSCPAAGSPVPINQRQVDCLKAILRTIDTAEIASLLDRLVHGDR